MAIPEFRFKHQKSPSTRTSVLGGISVAREPVVIDFSSTYANNQEAAISVDSYPVVASEANVSGIVGNLVVTDKLLDNGTFLFYEYQPLFDAAGSGVTVVDEDGEAVQHRVEFASIEQTDAGPNKDFFLASHRELDYDPLTGHSEIGLPAGPVTFAPFQLPSGELGYVTHSDSLAIGILRFPEINGSPLPVSGLIDFTFLSEADSTYTQVLYGDDWAVNIGSGLVSLEVNGSTSPTIPISHSTWYRGRVRYNEGGNTTVQVYRDTLIGQQTVADEIVPSGLNIAADDFYINHLTVYSHMPAFDWELPPVAPRYHHALRWRSYPTTTTAPFRIRVLTEGNDQAFLTYDAYKADGTVQQNRVEPMNLVPIYKESVTETNDWDKIGDRLILTGPLADAPTVYVKPVVEGLISVDVVNNNIVVTNGSFKSEPFDEQTGKYTYEVTEYEEMMPFEVDNQNLVTPRSLKEVRMKATVESAYTVKILPMNVFEGRYPTYHPELIEDIQKTVANESVVSVTGDVENVTWRKTRGIRVYVNGVQLGQDKIRAMDLNNGIVYLNRPVRPEDNVEITFLRRVQYFICNYPRIKPELVEGTSWRIYLRSLWPNYFLERPADTLERLAYRTMINGTPVGSLKSCVSDQVVEEVEGTIHLADISMVPTVSFDDARVFGGGLLPDSHFGSEGERRVAHKHSVYFTDIARFQSTAPEDFSSMIPWPTLLVRIPTTVRAAIEGRFSSADIALAYIKKTVEKHLALGTYYILIDENNNLWDKPFPLNSPQVFASAPRIEKP